MHHLARLRFYLRQDRWRASKLKVIAPVHVRAPPRAAHVILPKGKITGWKWNRPLRAAGLPSLYIPPPVISSWTTVEVGAGVPYGAAAFRTTSGRLDGASLVGTQGSRFWGMRRCGIQSLQPREWDVDTADFGAVSQLYRALLGQF